MNIPQCPVFPSGMCGISVGGGHPNNSNSNQPRFRGGFGVACVRVSLSPPHVLGRCALQDLDLIPVPYLSFTR